MIFRYINPIKKKVNFVIKSNTCGCNVWLAETEP